MWADEVGGPGLRPIMLWAEPGEGPGLGAPPSGGSGVDIPFPGGQKLFIKWCLKSFNNFYNLLGNVLCYAYWYIISTSSNYVKYYSKPSKP